MPKRRAPRSLAPLAAPAAAPLGRLLQAIRQPVINGYLVAGAVVGPGGFKLIKELVQVGGVGASVCVHARLDVVVLLCTRMCV